MTPSAKAAPARPAPGEFAAFYEAYVSKVVGTDIVSILEAQRLQMAQLFAARSERDGNFRYAPGKWTVKEVLGHIADSERIFAYRALRIARGDATPLSGFEQDDYVRAAGSAERGRACAITERRGVVMAAAPAQRRRHSRRASARTTRSSQRPPAPTPTRPPTAYRSIR